MTNISEQLPDKGQNVIGYDDRGNKYYAFRCACFSPYCESFRDQISGSELLVNIIRWELDNQDI